MENDDEYPICHYTGRCQTETGDKSDLDMCCTCGALMYYHDNEWIHHTVYDEIISNK